MVNARALGDTVETQVPLFDLGASSEDEMKIVWQSSDGNGNTDLADNIVSLKGESLSISEAISSLVNDSNTVNEGHGLAIDGYFGDWMDIVKYKDSDQLLDNPNIDIDEYAGVSQGTDSFFYLSVKGNVLAGTTIPADGARQIPTLSSNSNQIDIVTPVFSSDESQSSPELKGEDTIYIFLDTNGGVPYGFKVNNSFYANQLIEITGQHGIILSSVLYNYTSLDGTNAWDWSLVSAVNSASNKNEFECMVQNLPNEYGVYFHLISWDSEEDDSTSFLVQNKEGARGPGYGDEEQWSNGEVDSSAMSAIFDSNTGKVVIVYSDYSNSHYGTAVVGTISGTSVSFGTGVVFNSGWTDGMTIVYDSSNEKVVVAYIDESYDPSYSLIVKVGTVSGTSISFGSGTALDRVATVSGTFDSSNNKVILAFESQGDCAASGYSGCAVVGTVSGTSISFGTIVEFDDGAGVYHGSATFDSNSNKVVIAYSDQDDSSTGRAIVGTVSGTSISFGSPTTFNSGSTGDIATAFDTTNNKIVIVYRDIGNSQYGTAIVGTVSGTSISFGSEAVFNSARADSMWQIAFIPGLGTLIGFVTSGDGKAIYGTVSGTSISFDTATTFGDGGGYEAIIIAYDSENGKAIVIYEDNDDSHQGNARMTDIPEFSSLLMPIASVLLIVGFNYRRRESS
jgi:hypothetical protein